MYGRVKVKYPTEVRLESDLGADDQGLASISPEFGYKACLPKSPLDSGETHKSVLKF